MQLIPPQLKYTVEGSTPSYTDNEGQVIERDSQVRLRIKGIRAEMNQMFAVGSIREDYLGYVTAFSWRYAVRLFLMMVHSALLQ